MEEIPRAAIPLAVESVLQHLATPPRSLRSIRYRGDDCAVRLSELDLTDRDGVRALYSTLSRLEAAVTARRTAADNDAVSVASAFDADEALSIARTIGRRDAVRDDLRRALHDVRGGALTSLIVEVQRLRRRGTTDGAKSLATLAVLTSDHLKIMRNALLELDDTKRAADLRPCPHVVGRLAESLGRVTAEGARGPVHVDVRCVFSGAITMSCVELGALDRAALNLVNNAVRHAVGETVDVVLLPVADVPTPDLRVLVANRIDEAEAIALQSRFGDDLGSVFIDSFSTTGSGDGLKICVDFVSAAYGLARGADAVRSALVGASVHNGWFVAWLHWPAVA